MRRRPTIINDERGTAFAEALITLPIFVALLGGIVALSSMYGAKLEAKSRSRRLAWLQAESGRCPIRDCASSACGTVESDIRSRGLDDFQTVRGRGMSLGSFLDRIGGYLMGTYTDGVGSAEARLPSTSSSSTTVQRGITTLLCNTSSRQAEGAQTVLEHACATGLRTTEYASEVCR